MKQKSYSKNLLLFVIGILLLGYGIYLPFQPKSAVAHENIAIMEEGIVTTGNVVSIRKTMQKDPGKEADPGAPSRLYEIANIKYSVDGKVFDVIGSRPLSNQGWEKGNDIKVVYKIQNPKLAVVAESGVEGVNSYPYLPVVFLIGGISLTALGIVFTLRRPD